MHYIMRQYINKCKECPYVVSSQEYKNPYDLKSDSTKWYCTHSDKFYISNENDISENCPLRYKGELK